METTALIALFRRHRGTLSLKKGNATDEHILELVEEIRHQQQQQQEREASLQPLQLLTRNKRKPALLRTIDLPGNDIEDNGAMALATLFSRIPSLRICNLSSNRIGSCGIRALLSSVANSNLTALNLAHNPGLTDIAPEEISLLKQELNDNKSKIAKERELRRKRAAPDTDSPSLEPWRVAVIGGGIAGCAVARALQQQGFNCVVYEKDAALDSRHQGYGLTIQQATQV